MGSLMFDNKQPTAVVLRASQPLSTHNLLQRSQAPSAANTPDPAAGTMIFSRTDCSQRFFAMGRLLGGGRLAVVKADAVGAFSVGRVPHVPGSAVVCKEPTTPVSEARLGKKATGGAHMRLKRGFGGMSEKSHRACRDKARWT